MINDKHTPTVIPVTSPWLDTLSQALSTLRQTLFIVSPYIKKDAIEAIKQALLTNTSKRPAGIVIHIITRANPTDFLQGSSDIEALQHLLSWSTDLPGSQVEIRVIPNVHAKIWLIDQHFAIVGSSNATLPGLTKNLEYGIAISDPQIVEQIINDWQPWWDQAEQVDATLLQELAQQLQLIKNSDELRQVQAQEKHIRQQLQQIHRIGKPVSFPTKPAHPHALVLKEQPAPFSTTIPRTPNSDKIVYIAIPAPEDLQDPQIFRQAIDIPMLDFWYALKWVLPFDTGENGLFSSTSYPAAQLKISRKTTPHDQQELLLTWADGKRYSQAALPASSETPQQAWAITLDSKHIYMLIEMLYVLKKDNFFVRDPQPHFHLLLHPSSALLFLSYLRNPTDSQSSAAIVVPCTPASLPANFPSLRPPISSITIAHKELQAAFLHLTHEWQTHYGEETPLNSIELNFPINHSQVTLSTGQIEAALTTTIESTTAPIAGPSVRIRIDHHSLEQVITSAQNTVQHWQISADRYASALHFLPEPNIQSNRKLLWRHELRNQ